MQRAGRTQKNSGRVKKVTLKDIARKCNVSIMTVSLALNGKKGVSKKTTEKIRSAIREFDYTPNMIARSLRVSATNAIGLVTSDSSHFLFAKLLKTIGNIAEEAGYSIVIANTDQNPDRERRAIEVLINKRIDGLFLAAPIFPSDEGVEYAFNHGTPIVMAMRTSKLDIDSVCNDNFSGAYGAVEYLIKSGSRRIGMIGLPETSQSGSERLRGYRRALSNNGMRLSARLVRHVEPQIVDGEQAMREWLGYGVKVDAVVCGCDLIAIGVMKAIREEGLKIPDDIRVCGFDDIELLEHLAVPLTTVRQPIEMMARTGFMMLIERIKSPKLPARRIVLPGELVVRSST